MLNSRPWRQKLLHTSPTMAVEAIKVQINANDSPRGLVECKGFGWSGKSPLTSTVSVFL